MPPVEACLSSFKICVCERLLVVLVEVGIAHVKARFAVARVVLGAFANEDERARIRDFDIFDGGLHINQCSARLYSVEDPFLLRPTTIPSLG
jgi:hypothetical protein